MVSPNLLDLSFEKQNKKQTKKFGSAIDWKRKRFLASALIIAESLPYIAQDKLNFNYKT